MHDPAIDKLVQASLESEDKNLRLEWIPFSTITDITSTSINNVYYASTKAIWRGIWRGELTLVLLGSSKECIPTFVSEFARIYSLPTHKYNSINDNFKRYSRWLNNRNHLIGFTQWGDNYYMVAKRRFYQFYSQYGFCTACGLLRCSPVWCVCGHKQLSDGWTSNNKQLDELIKNSQLQTYSPNHAYLEWIPFDCIEDRGIGYGFLYDLTMFNRVTWIPLEITDETDDLYYAELCDKYPDILTTDVWITMGFTYHASEEKYCLITVHDALCLACAGRLEPRVNAFCYLCKAPKTLSWTTGNRSLDTFIMESWKNTEDVNDTYLQWIEYSQLINVQEMTQLYHGCTLIIIANWLDPMSNKWTKVSLKNIHVQLFDFHQVTKKYPEILTPKNMLIIGITQEPSTQEYYLVFYHEIHTILDKIINSSNQQVKYMEYSDFGELKEIASGSHKTVYTAEYEPFGQTVILKRFKNFYQMMGLFITEFRNHTKLLCNRYSLFFRIYGVTQVPETEEYMIAMQYANNGSLLSYLDQNINKLTWRMKLQHLCLIALNLMLMHSGRLVHCNLHGGSIVLHNTRPFISDLGLSQSVNAPGSNSSIQSSLPFIAPEVFHTYKFTPKSDMYSIGIIMYLIATGEPPFRDRQFDKDLACDITGGLRPTMPDAAPKEYKELAERCCDADPDKRPDIKRFCADLVLYRDDKSDVLVWDVIYDVKPLSRLEKNE